MPDSDIDVRLGIEYANHDGEALLGDLYAPGGPGPYPALVLIHGGGRKLASRALYQHWGPYLARNGYAAFSVDYRLSKPGKPTYPQAVHDMKAAIQYLRGNAATLKVEQLQRFRGAEAPPLLARAPIG
jgi:acetyl esterase/lipase